ncbi:MAG: hypothetical protein ACE5EK_08195, partial [Nitrospinales bacterium]
MQKSMRTLFSLIGIMAVLLLQAGCGKLGPSSIKVERNNYNIAIQRSNDEQLLVNLVRLKYRDMPFFLEVSSVASQLTLRTTAEANVDLPESGLNIFGFGAGATLEEKPTVTYAPLQGDAFTQRFLSRISLDTVFLLLNSGWSVERIFRLCFQRLNKLKNAPNAASPTPAKVPVFKKFIRAMNVLRKIQIRDGLNFKYEVKNKIPHLILQVRSEELSSSEFKKFNSLLGVSPNKSRYVLTPALLPDETDQIKIETRSILGIMYYLSQGVEAFAKDREMGKVTITLDADRKPFDWTWVTGDLLRIKSSLEKPDHA